MSDDLSRARQGVFPTGMATYWHHRTVERMDLETAAEAVSLAMSLSLLDAPSVRSEGARWGNRSRETLRQMETYYGAWLRGELHRAEAKPAPQK